MKNYFILQRSALALMFVMLFLELASGAHYIVGIVNDARDGRSANGLQVVLWNPASGIQDNQTDVIGTSGNSGADNIYMIDCEMLSPSCNIGDQVRIKVLDSTSPESEENFLAVSGDAYDIMGNLTLNTPPNSTLTSPLEEYNSSNTSQFLNCSASDLDANLKNLTLYGNWSDGWHANQTLSISGSLDSAQFEVNLPEGRYQWGCFVADNNSASSFSTENYTLTIDTTPPVIDSVYTNESYVCGTTSLIRVNCTIIDALNTLGTINIEAIKPSQTRFNTTAQLLSGSTYYADISLTEEGSWKFSCIANDSVGNQANFSSENISAHSALSDLEILFPDISFSDPSPQENHPLTINAVVKNLGCADANNFYTSFYEGSPSLGIQIGLNQTTSVPALSNRSANVSWNPKAGKTNIFVLADSNMLIAEFNETNNQANKTISVNGWQEFYGNISLTSIIRKSDYSEMLSWMNSTGPEGELFVADSESIVSWLTLQAIGRDKNSIATPNDFSEIDSLLNMSYFDDSVSSIFTIDGNSPKATADFLIRNTSISNVPVINSTDNEIFTTGILWDYSTDTDGEFSQADAENLVFTTKVNKSQPGKYGDYDYEIKIPVKLREYKGPDTSNVYFYYELV